MKTTLESLRNALAIFATLGLFATPLFAQQAYIHGDVEPGEYEVGFKVFHEYDYSRTFKPDFNDDGVTLSTPNPRPMRWRRLPRRSSERWRKRNSDRQPWMTRLPRRSAMIG